MRGKHPNSQKNLNPARPGEVRNPLGRRNAGATIREWVNALVDETEPQLRRIARDKAAPSAKRAAAERIIRSLEAPDMSDFHEFLSGAKTIKQLKTGGVNTELVKKVKQKSRMVPTGDGQYEEVIERELELHDRSGADFDRVVEHTDGRPNQNIAITEPAFLRTPEDRAIEADDLTDRFRRMFNPLQD